MEKKLDPAKNVSTKGMSFEDWLTFRKGGIGGSDVPAILGISRFKTPYDVWLDKTSPDTNRIDNPRMKAGRILEDAIANWWAEDFQFQVRRDNKIRVHPTIPFLIGDIDRTIISPERGMGILEAKNTTSWTYNQWKENGISMEYYFQIQHYFSVMPQANWGAAAILVDGWMLQSIDLEPNREVISELEEKLVSFWENHVVKMVPPEPINSEDIKKMFPVASPLTSIVADDMVGAQVKDLMGVKAQIKTLEEAEGGLTVKIQNYMRGYESLVDKDTTPIATWRQDKDGVFFDHKRFLAENKDACEPYLSRRPGGRRFLLKGKLENNK